MARLIIVLVTGIAAASARAEDPISFERDIRPILFEKCLACHGADPKDIKGKLDLRTREAMLKGGQSGKPAVIPNKPDESLLYQAIRRINPDLAMPPKENDKLTAVQIERFRQWIAAGAVWSDGGVPANKGVKVATSGGQSPEWTNRQYDPADLWAYRSVGKPKPPCDEPKANSIDAFLRARQKEKGIDRTAEPAELRTLLRRITIDLTGLPPTPDEIDRFMKESVAAPQAAYDALIDRLLKGPRYGEQMARHWLDVVRYADTAGFSNDWERPNAWRYRDYVIRSFNADKAFDRFILEQIAGDELDANDPEMRIAVGFLRMGPWEHTGMSVAALTRQQFLDDVTHSVGVTFLGQGLRCASCHDHKFDPIPTKDYYRLQAVFGATQFVDRPAKFLGTEATVSFADCKTPIEDRLKTARANKASLLKKSEDAIAAYLNQRGVASLTDLPETDRPKKERFGLSNLELSLIRINQKRIETFERELQRFEPNAFSVYNGPANNYNSNRPLTAIPAQRNGSIADVRILPGGALDTPGEAVTPGILSVLPLRSEIPNTTDGRRLALAKWIASPDNTLTARVIVNRVWQWHFGKGLVATPNNFGKMGKKPTHPELLDWLARWFIDNGWSIKKLHRVILSSDAYRQADSHPDADKLTRIDPSNELLASFPTRRLAAEEIRDGMLAISGELNPLAGGPGIFPEINWEVALQPRHTMGSVAPAYQPSPLPEQRNRRTIYAFRRRTLSDPLLEVFNRPGSDTSCDCRDETTVSPQAFALMNSDFAHDRALALAADLEKRTKDRDEQICFAFLRCYGRAASKDELAICRAHVARQAEHHRANPPKPFDLPLRVKRKMVEEMTGEEYEWEEELDGMKNYRRDLKRWQVGPDTRALADLCLVLFNSNEFLYLR